MVTWVGLGVLLCGSLTACLSTARVNDVYMALDSNGDRQRSVFFTDTKEIHCVVELGIGRAGVTFETIIRQLQAYDFVTDKTFFTDRVTTSVESSPSPSSGIQKADVVMKPRGPDGAEVSEGPFQPGHFVCEAYLDGKLEQSAVFNVDFPDCPASTIQARSACFGFYPQNKSCKKYGLTSTDNAQCRCSATKGWECDG